MNKEYYLITRIDEGTEIEPYMIDTESSDLDYHLKTNGDSERYYKKLTKDDVIDNMKKGIKFYNQE